MRVLVTRPASEALRTKARLEALGHQVLVAPMMQIATLDVVWPDGAVDAIAATSAHAFASLGRQVAPEACRLMPLLLVGDRTEQSARRAGWRGPAVVAMTATELVAKIAGTSRKRRIVYMAGRDRKPTLEDGLGEQGHAVTTLETYEAVPAAAFEASTAVALRNETAEVVLHYSRRSATLFLDLAAEAQIPVTRLMHACLSSDVAVPLHDHGCNHIMIAAAPSEAALIASLDLRVDQA